MSKIPKNIKSDLRIILDYLLDSEEKHYEESDRADGHIYENAKRASDWLRQA